VYRLPFEVESLLARSFPARGDVAGVRARYHAGIEDDGVGLHLTRWATKCTARTTWLFCACLRVSARVCACLRAVC